MSKNTTTTIHRLRSYINKIEAENGVGGRWQDTHPMPTIPKAEDLTVWLSEISKSNSELGNQPIELVELALAAKLEGL